LAIRSFAKLVFVVGAALGAAAIALGVEQAPATAGAPAEPVDYLTQIKPLLKARCYTCHGALRQKSGLRLDTVAAMFGGGKSGPVIARGDAGGSGIVARVSTTDVSDRMPPEHEGEPFSADEVKLLSDWIAAGAPAPADEKPEADADDHWAFRERVRPQVPAAANAAWVRNPIDSFISQAHEQQGLAPQPEASRAVQLRRLYVDLIGVPPTLEQIAACENDTAPDWYEKVVDRLLNDPHHGERWGRHWMDVWRYSEWWGLGEELRFSQKHIWHWRDWIVESLNADLGYDEMVCQMLAADELYPLDPQKLRATGYLARNYFLFNRDFWLEDTVEHVSKGFLGLTVNCAKCHDHKFDPIAQKDYYALRAVFEPYHVRNDLTPGETDIERDGIPRAFDARPDVPTYLYRRGQSSDPDKAAAVPPGVPRMLNFREFKVEPVSLPTEAYRPGLKPFVVESHLKRAEQRVGDGRKAVETAKLALADSVLAANPAAAPAPSAPAVTTQPTDGPLPLDQAILAVRVAERALAAAEAQLASVKARAEADRVRCQEPVPPNSAELVAAAVRAERLAAVAQAEEDVARARLDVLRAVPEKKAETDQKLATAEAAREAAAKQVGEAAAGDYAPLVGAVWAKTKFGNSTNFDPDPGFPRTSTGRRSALAAWITDPKNPLTGRVAANHIWMRHMGTPLVASTFDFGRKNPDPTHPALLDWLACELVDSGWSMKHLHRLIVTSAAYRMSSTVRGAEANVKKDPDNLYYWRRAPIRIEAQVVRDSILALSGQLDLSMGGPPVPLADQDASRRRSLYLFRSNIEENVFLSMFDDAPVQECYRREQSIVPQQALALTNSKLVYEAAGHVARRLSEASGPAGVDDTAFIRQAFLLIVAAEPGEAEIDACRRALDEWRKLPAGSERPDGADARANLVWALLSHNDFVTLR
jgi:hypothetical protein